MKNRSVQSQPPLSAEFSSYSSQLPSGSPAVAILLPSLMGGGAERVAVNLANEFVARGVPTDLVLMQAEGGWLQHVDPRVGIVDLGVARVRHLLFPLVRYWKTRRPRTLMAYMWPLTIVAFCARVLAGVASRLVFSEHTTWSVSEMYAKRLTRLRIKVSMRVLYRCADAVMSVSAGSARDLEKIAWLDRGSVITVYNPIVGARAIDAGSASCVKEWSVGAHKRVIAVGTLKAIKDYRTLLIAFDRVARDVDSRLLILGEGEERSDLQALVSQLGLGGRVFMPGFVIDPGSYLAQADLHVLSSKGEGFGNVIVEALEHGVPVVSTDCPSGPREILEDGKYGALVPVGDVVALAHAMQEALSRSHDPEALKLRARAFSVNSAADAYLKILLGPI